MRKLSSRSQAWEPDAVPWPRWRSGTVCRRRCRSLSRLAKALAKAGLGVVSNTERMDFNKAGSLMGAPDHTEYWRSGL